MDEQQVKIRDPWHEFICEFEWILTHDKYNVWKYKDATIAISKEEVDTGLIAPSSAFHVMVIAAPDPNNPSRGKILKHGYLDDSNALMSLTLDYVDENEHYIHDSLDSVF